MRELVIILSSIAVFFYLVFLVAITCHTASTTWTHCDHTKTRFDYVFPSTIIGCWLREEVK